MELKIESGIPIPPRNRRSGSKYPFADMKSGDSFFVEGARAPTLRSAVGAYCKKAKLGPGVFAVRSDGDGHRVWRME